MIATSLILDARHITDAIRKMPFAGIAIKKGVFRCDPLLG